MSVPYLELLTKHVTVKPILILRLSGDEWHALHGSRRGLGEYTTALPHNLVAGLKTPTICLVLAKTDSIFQDEEEAPQHAYLGLVSSRSAITTLETRIKVKRALEITPSKAEDLLALVTNASFSYLLRERFEDRNRATLLSPKASGHLLERIASISTNIGALQSLAAVLSTPRYFRGNESLQNDAVRTALRAFGLGPDDRAISLEIHPENDTALARIPVIEDAVIEHDARSIPGHELIGSDRTGRAIFERDGNRLEVFTANRRQLEQAFGVDLIYLNVTRRNLVMLQYKMLEPPKRQSADWLYTPDSQLKDELARMRKFALTHAPGVGEYRLNPSAFYLKFVKRNAALRNGGIIMPIDHYDTFVQSPASRGPRGGLRIGYSALGGSYMRETPFLDLIRAGYIGARVETTNLLMTLVHDVLTRGRAAVAAIQTAIDPDRAASDPDPDNDFDLMDALAGDLPEEI